MVTGRSRCREAYCRGEEPTKNYIKLVLAPHMGHGIMPNTVGESQEIRVSFFIVYAFATSC